MNPLLLLARLPRLAYRLIRRLMPAPPLQVTWQRTASDSWLASNIQGAEWRPPALPLAQRIEAQALRTESMGPQPLWDGYRQVYQSDPNVPWAKQEMQRTSEQVRSQPTMGRLFAWLAASRRPDLIVEIGTAFGISGMYWLAGLEAARNGRLLTFEPNEVWQRIAARNLRAISDRAVSVLGTFEDEFEKQAGGQAIDLAFVDAIHTSAFVDSQFNLLLPHMSPGGLILLDDISFSPDMAACWQRLSHHPKARASVALDNRLGIIEF